MYEGSKKGWQSPESPSRPPPSSSHPPVFDARSPVRLRDPSVDGSQSLHVDARQPTVVDPPPRLDVSKYGR